MNFLKNLFSSGVEKVVDSVTSGLDALFTSDEERLTLKNKLQIELNKLQIELETGLNEYEKEITKRWQSDNEHIVTRLVRPFSFVLVLVLFCIMALGDGNFGNLSIKPAYIPVIETLLSTMTIAYFGSRGIEKSIKHFKGEKK